MKKLNIILILLAISIMSCSKDSPEEKDEKDLQSCVIEAADTGCAVVYLNARENGWIRISKQGDLANPNFMYLSGDTSDPYGTVTVFLENGQPLIKFTDMVLNDYLVSVSQSSDGSDPVCQVEENIETPDTDDEATSILVNEEFEFPFYIQLQANVCF